MAYVVQILIVRLDISIQKNSFVESFRSILVLGSYCKSIISHYLSKNCFDESFINERSCKTRHKLSTHAQSKGLALLHSVTKLEQALPIQRPEHFSS
jgi:hypothetical protein